MLVMKLMMRSYFRLMVGRNQSDCYIQFWESKTSQSGRPFSPSDASHRPLSPRGLTRKFVFPPSPETSSEQMSSEPFQRFCDACFARRRRRLRCPALRASRVLSLTGWPRSSCGSESQASKQFERLFWLQITGRIDQEQGSISRLRQRRQLHVVTLVRLPRRARGQGLHAWCREPWQVAGWPLALHQIVGSVALRL